MALVDADYKFLFVDIGAAGRCGDAGVFNQSKLKSCMDHNDLNFPEPQLLQSTAEEEHLCSYHIVGDDAFSLRTDLMKPYPHKCPEKEERILTTDYQELGGWWKMLLEYWRTVSGYF